MENSSQHFSYQPLYDNSIRLVTIKPGSWDSIIECEVTVGKLGQGENPFRALSYVWGDSNIRRTIHLNGNKFEVTVNLFEGLQQIRESTFEAKTLPQLPIWVDAICINQDDKEEKANQVPNMHQIYSTAKEVLLWLGVMPIPPNFLKPWIDDDKYSWMGFDNEDCPMSEVLREEALARYTVYVRSPQFPIQRLSRQPAGKARTQQLMHFAVAAALRHCTYFQRIWTVQEAVLAKDGPVILVNRHLLNWDQFTHKDRLEPEESVEVLDRPHTSFIGISSLRKQLAVGYDRWPHERLLDVIEDFSDLACTEAVDKIYGLLAMVPLHDLPKSLWPDYDIPCEEVYWKYSKYIFKKTGSLTLLDRYTKPLPGVPSWVPAIGTNQQKMTATASSAYPPGFSDDSREMSISGYDYGVCIDRTERPLTISRPEDLEFVGTSMDLRDTMNQLRKQITAPLDPRGMAAWEIVTRTGIWHPAMIHPKSPYNKTLVDLAQSMDLDQMKEFCSKDQDLAAHALEGWREIATFAWSSLRTSKGKIFTFRDKLWLDDLQPRKGDHIFKPLGMKGIASRHILTLTKPTMSASNENQASVTLLKTCQTCFNLKIKCDKTQDSDLCDRCLRLGKTCVFNPARRRPRNTSRHRLELRSKSKRDSKSPSNSGASASIANPGDIFNKDASLDPFQRGILSLEDGDKLLEYFRSRMTPYFPFVVFPKDISVSITNSYRPCACLAALAAASHADTNRQKALGDLFNQVVAAKMISGKFNDLDLLHGLLIHLAWAHYQPRPKRYTQHLHLATSIISDMRLDRPRRPELWDVGGGKDRNEPDWGPPEMRALAGAYYLSSTSSIVLQKSRHMSYSPYISRCCEHLGLLNQHPTDKYLVYIIRVQTLIERVDDIVSKPSAVQDLSPFWEETQRIAQECTEIKATLPFPLSDSPPLLLQLHMLELLLSQASPRGTPFGLDKFQQNQNPPEGQASHIDWLSASMSAARSLISVVLVLPHGEEMAMSNMGWIMIYCGLSLAVRLDLIAIRGSISGSTGHLRRFLDMPHTLRQIILRLRTAAGSEKGAERHPFEGLADRVLRLELWYHHQAGDDLAITTTPSPQAVNQPNVAVVEAESMPVANLSAYPDVSPWGGGWYQGGDFDISTFLFTDPVDMPGNFGLPDRFP
ncbi:hypothetical protein CDV36_003718 [Fusarium kuroshium]|uniref:Zn(2)-C6 fungal-type domain-containing protein n=1 Tax=Fusarium kuroshium TaxID=2010991 RepID=A0A3M2SGB0_9HYPO|nr:hypothetical protein CDV36_003718 [Fusarium kuroshium]